MDSDGYQAADFLKILYPTVKKYRTDLQVSCCDATGARQERNLLYELDQAGGGRDYDIATWHNYQSMPERPFNTQGRLLQYDLGYDRSACRGFTVGDLHVSDVGSYCMKVTPTNTDHLGRHQAFVYSDTSGYLHWWCAQDNPGNTTGSDAILVRLQGDTFEVSRRLWASALPARGLFASMLSAPQKTSKCRHLRTRMVHWLFLLSTRHILIDRWS